MDRGLKSLSRSVQEQLLSQLADSKFKNKREASLFPSSFADASERLVEMVDQVFQAQARRTIVAVPSRRLFHLLQADPTDFVAAGRAPGGPRQPIAGRAGRDCQR